MTRREEALRRLCFYYELGDKADAANALQEAADAVAHGALSADAADALVAVWQPFVGVEAQMGRHPQVYKVAHRETELQRAVVADIRRMITRTTDHAKRLHVTRLLKEQIQILERRAAA
jgi:hypothetical protein